MRHILVFAEVDSLNLGDRAIFRGMSSMFRAQGCSVSALSIEKCKYYADFDKAIASEGLAAGLAPSRSPGCGTFLNIALTVLRKIYLPIWAVRYWIRLSATLNKMNRPDLVVVGGGGILMNNNYHFPIAMALLSRTLQKRGVPYGLSGVSTGGELDNISRYLFSFVVERAKFVYPRDKSTLNFVQRWVDAERCDAKQGADFAFYISDEFPRYVQGNPIRVAVNITCNSIPISSKDFNDYREKTKKLIEELSSDARFKVVLFTTGWPDDESELKALTVELNADGVSGFDVYSGSSSLDGLLQFLATVDLVLAARLHSGILGIVKGAQVVPLPYNRKTANFMDSIGLGRSGAYWFDVNWLYEEFTKMAGGWSLNSKSVVDRQRELSRTTLGQFIQGL